MPIISLHPTEVEDPPKVGDTITRYKKPYEHKYEVVAIYPDFEVEAHAVSMRLMPPEFWEDKT